LQLFWNDIFIIKVKYQESQFHPIRDQKETSTSSLKFLLSAPSQPPTLTSEVDGKCTRKKINLSILRSNQNQTINVVFLNKKKLKALDMHSGSWMEKSRPSHCFCFYFLQPTKEGKPSIARLLIKCQLIFNFIAAKCLKCFNINYILSLLILFMFLNSKGSTCLKNDFLFILQDEWHHRTFEILDEEKKTFFFFHFLVMRNSMLSC
jgi:hypothetical protein